MKFLLNSLQNGLKFVCACASAKDDNHMRLVFTTGRHDAFAVWVIIFIERMKF